MASAKKDNELQEVLKELVKAVRTNQDRFTYLYIGIDPGSSGAISFICGKWAGAIDIPVLKVRRSKGWKTVPDYNKIIFIFELIRDQMQCVSLTPNTFVMIEEPPPSMGKRKGSPYGQMRLGMAYAIWPLFLTSLRFKVQSVAPVKWKRQMRLLKQGKEVSRRKAIKLFPTAILNLKRHHDRAEALLLALYGKLYWNYNDPKTATTKLPKARKTRSGLGLKRHNSRRKK